MPICYRRKLCGKSTKRMPYYQIIRYKNVILPLIKLAVLCNLLFADDDLYVLADFKKLIVAALVYLIFLMCPLL